MVWCGMGRMDQGRSKTPLKLSKGGKKTVLGGAANGSDMEVF